MFPRCAAGRITFMATWWMHILRYGAQAKGCLADVDHVYFDTYVDGQPKPYRRYYNNKDYTVHEAFLVGDTASVNVMLPDQVSVEQFSDMMGIAGRFRGISPYRHRDGWGRFTVEKVEEV